MNAVVDSNVIAYYMLGAEPFAEETGDFWRTVKQTCAPAHWAAEFANVLWMATRAGVLTAEEAHHRLDFSSRLRIRSIPIRTVWQGALAQAAETGACVYDTLFVELAIREKLPLVTFDRRILEKFPAVAVRPAALFSK